MQKWRKTDLLFLITLTLLLAFTGCAQESKSPEIAAAPSPQAEVSDAQIEAEAKKIAEVQEDELSPEAIAAGEEYAERVDALFEGVNTASLNDDIRAEAVNAAEMKARFPIDGQAHFIAGLGVARSRCCNSFGQSFSVGHKGVDWGAKMGTPIVAVWGGRVVYAAVDSIGGNVVKIMHPDGKSTYYAHMRDHAMVKKGQLVKQGQQLGVVGMSGNARGTVPHLHFELRRGGSVLDPLSYIPKKN